MEITRAIAGNCCRSLREIGRQIVKRHNPKQNEGKPPPKDEGFFYSDRSVSLSVAPCPDFMKLPRIASRLKFKFIANHGRCVTGGIIAMNWRRNLKQRFETGSIKGIE